MSEPVTCAECIHFRRDTINPVEGLGWCPPRDVVRYPMAPHYCRQRQVETHLDGTPALLGYDRAELTRA